MKKIEDKNKLWIILNICSQVRDINRESLSLKEKIILPFKIYKWKRIINKEIESLKKDAWSYEYIQRMNLTLQNFYDDNMETIAGSYFTISELDKGETLGRSFKEMLFADYNKDTVITIKYMYSNIKFIVFNIKTGNKYELNSVSTLTKQQLKLAEACKGILIDGLKEYINVIFIPFKK